MARLPHHRKAENVPAGSEGESQPKNEFRWSGRLGAALLSALLLLTAACGSKSITAPSTTCSFAVGQTTTAFGAESGSASVAVTTSSGCAWTAVSSASFITITQGATGSGTGTVQFSVAANTGAARSGTLTVGGVTITISQAAAASTPPPASPTLSTPSLQSPSGGQTVDSLTPTLVLNNAPSTGNIGAVTYRFEASELDSFPDGSRTFTQDGVAQGSPGTTSLTVPRPFVPNTLYFWRARATNGTITTAFSGIETFRTPILCAFALSTPSVSVDGSGGTSSVTVTAGNTCNWTATSNDPFITVTSGSSGTGDGTVTFSTSVNLGTARTGTLTIAGQTVTVNQSAGVLIAAFQLFDPAAQVSATTECRFRSLPGGSTTCAVESTSLASGTNTIVSYAWTIQYTYVTVKTVTGTTPRLSFTDTCGQVSSTADGVAQPLQVQLTVTDNLGNTATAISGAGGQPLLQVRLFTCGP